MAFTVSDFEDLVKLLGEHPEWQARLRPVILGEELLLLPSRMDRVEAALDRVAEDLVALKEESARLVEATRQNASQIAVLVEQVGRLDGRVSNLEGDHLEDRYARHAASWFSPWLRRVHLLNEDDTNDLFEALAAQGATPADLEGVRNIDLLVSGLDRSTGEEVTLAVEISYTVNVHDVECAIARAAILRKAGFAARPFAGGYRASENAVTVAAQENVVIDLHRPISA